MAILRFTIILCFAGFYTFAQVSALRLPETQTIGDPASDVLALFAELEEIVNGAIKNAVKTLFGYIDQLDRAASAVVDRVKQALDVATKPFLNAIGKLEAQAAIAGVDITMCLGTGIGDITTLSEEYLRNVTSCLDTKLSEAKKYINKIIEDVESTVDVVTDMDNDINKCAMKPLNQQGVCYAEVATKISASIVSLPTKIASDVENVKIYIHAALPPLTLCGNGVVAAFGVDAAKIVAEITTCAVAKMNGSRFEDLDLFA